VAVGGSLALNCSKSQESDSQALMLNHHHQRATLLIRLPDLPLCFLQVSSNSEMGRAEGWWPLVARWAVGGSLALNCSLVVAKAVAIWLSGSVALLASLIDSALDVLSGLVLFLTKRAELHTGK
jgi:hypothetical protein